MKVLSSSQCFRLRKTTEVFNNKNDFSRDTVSSGTSLSRVSITKIFVKANQKYFQRSVNLDKLSFTAYPKTDTSYGSSMSN